MLKNSPWLNYPIPILIYSPFNTHKFQGSRQQSSPFVFTPYSLWLSALYCCPHFTSNNLQQGNITTYHGRQSPENTGMMLPFGPPTSNTNTTDNFEAVWIINHRWLVGWIRNRHKMGTPARTGRIAISVLTAHVASSVKIVRSSPTEFARPFENNSPPPPLM